MRSNINTKKPTPLHISTANYDFSSTLQDSTLISPRLNRIRKTGSQNDRTEILIDNKPMLSNAGVAEFGSLTRQRNERKNNFPSLDKIYSTTKTISNFKNLPIKNQQQAESISFENFRSEILIENKPIISKASFAEFGSLKKQKSERKNDFLSLEKTNSNANTISNFKNLPIKTQQQGELISSDNFSSEILIENKLKQKTERKNDFLSLEKTNSNAKTISNFKNLPIKTEQQGELISSENFRSEILIENKLRQKSERKNYFSSLEKMNPATKTILNFKDLPIKTQQQAESISSESFRSEILFENKPILSKAVLSEFGSLTRQKNESKSDFSSLEKINSTTKTISNFKNVPIKTQQQAESISSDNSPIVKPKNVYHQLSQPQRYNPTTDIIAQDPSFFDLEEEKVLFSPTSQQKSDINSSLSSPRFQIVPQSQSYQKSIEYKDKEISRLQKNLAKLSRKVNFLQENNEKLQIHLKNLLGERKHLLHQIENSEFEEIIEEEEIQQAMPNYNHHENLIHLEHIRAQSVNNNNTQSENVSHVNCIDKRSITLDDVPQKMLELFRNDILRNAKEESELEKRLLMETLKIEHRKQIESLTAEFEDQKPPLQQISISTNKKARFSEIGSEVNFQNISSPKTFSKSFGMNTFQKYSHQQSQYELSKSENFLNKYIAKASFNKWQKSIIEKLIKAVEDNDYDGLIKNFEEFIFKPTKSIAINNSPLYINKSVNTAQLENLHITVDVDSIIEQTKPRISQESRAILVKPTVMQHGCQSEKVFKFEVGMMTDQIGYRTQRTMTDMDYIDFKSSSNYFEVRSPIKDFVDNLETTASSTIFGKSETAPVEYKIEAKRITSENLANHIRSKEKMVEDKVEKESRQISKEKALGNVSYFGESDVIEKLHFENEDFKEIKESRDFKESSFIVGANNQYEESYTVSSINKISDNISSSNSRYGIVTQVPFNFVNNSTTFDSISSSHSSYHSLYSIQEMNKVEYKTEYSKFLLSEDLIANCNELCFYLRFVSLVTTLTIEHLPRNIGIASSALINWWIDVILNVDAEQLMIIIKFLILTFSKNFLKYLIINLDEEGNSCLHYIIIHQMWDSYDALDSTNLVDPNLYNSQGFTVLMVACTIKVTNERDQHNFLRLVSGAHVNLRSKQKGQTAIFIAAFHNNSQTIQILCTKGADINIRDNNDVTPLMVACSKNNIDAVATILSWYGVLVDLTNKDGKNALNIAEEGNFMELLEIFRQRKATKASEISNYSMMVQNSYNTVFAGLRKY